MARLPNVWASPFLRAAEARKTRARQIAKLVAQAKDQSVERPVAAEQAR